MTYDPTLHYWLGFTIPPLIFSSLWCVMEVIDWCRFPPGKIK